jgi:hypothetical protein
LPSSARRPITGPSSPARSPGTSTISVSPTALSRHPGSQRHCRLSLNFGKRAILGSVAKVARDLLGLEGRTSLERSRDLAQGRSSAGRREHRGPLARDARARARTLVAPHLHVQNSALGLSRIPPFYKFGNKPATAPTGMSSSRAGHIPNGGPARPATHASRAEGPHVQRASCRAPHLHHWCPQKICSTST